MRHDARRSLLKHAVATTQGDSSPEVDVGPVIIDSGAARHLVSRHYAELFPDFIRDTDQVVHLTTADGEVDCNREFECRFKGYSGRVTALILDVKPSVISLGIVA